MKLPTKFSIYLCFVHLLLTGLLVWAYQDYGLWFFLLEGLLLISLLYGYFLIKSLLAPLKFLDSSIELLEEDNYTTRFRTSGKSELDLLIGAYNRMVDNLRHERLRLGEQRGIFEALLRATPAAILTLDFDGRIVMANPAGEALLGSTTANLAGRTLDELDHPLANDLDALPLGEPRVLSFRGRRRLKCQKSRFLDRGFFRFFFLIEEVTEELRQSQADAYEKLIRMMSHEVNNTIGAANSVLDTCLGYQDQLNEADRVDFSGAIQVVISRTRHLSQFMRELANLVRLPEPVLRPTPLAELLRDLERLLRTECDRREIVWHCALPESMAAIDMDRHLMEQALLNIVKNAIEAIGNSGSIEILAERMANAWVLVVLDSGGGLSAEVQAQLFKPFFSTKPQGQGLGLVLVQTILHKHGFDFALESSDDGRTRFSIQFPDRPARPAPGQ